jgi:hypothetical protein
MAARYWVGGAGTWSSANTANWSAAAPLSFTASCSSTTLTTSTIPAFSVGMTVFSATGVSLGTITGGSGTSWTVSIGGTYASQAMTAATVGASVPGSADTPQFDANSGTGTVTYTATGTTGAPTINNPNITLSLSAGYTSSATITLTAGTLLTNGNALGATTISASGSGVRTLNLGSSIVTLSANFTATTIANFTFVAGTSQINLTGGASNINAGGLTFNNVSFTSTAQTTPSINGNNTFNTVTIAARATSGVSVFSIAGNQTITNLVLPVSTSAVNRTFFTSDAIGTQRTLNCATVNTGLANIDFRDIAITGAVAPISGLRFGDCKGNSGITFSAGVNKYWNLATGTSWISVAWATTPGGAVSLDNFPLAQDTAVFFSTGLNSGSTVTIGAAYNIGSIDMSARTSNTMTLATGLVNPIVYGNWINGTGTTLTGSGTIYFSGKGVTQQITGAGRSFTQNVNVDSINGTLQLQDAVTVVSTQQVALTSGTLDLNNQTLSTGAFSASVVAGTPRTLAFGTGVLSLTGTATVFTALLETGFSVTGSKTVNVTSVGATAITVSSGTLTEANALDFNFTGGTYALSSASLTARSLNFTGYSGTWSASSATDIYGSLTLSAGMTVVASTGTMSFIGTSGTQTITSFGKNIDRNVTVNAPGGTVRLAGSLNMGVSKAFVLTAGTFDMNGYDVIVGTVAVTGTNTRTLAIGSGTLNLWLSTTTTFNATTTTNLTVTGTGVINFTGVSVATFVGGGIQTYPTLAINQGSTVTVTGSNKFQNVINGAFVTLLFTAGTTNEFTAFSLSGNAVDGFFSLGAAGGGQAILKKSSTWYMGANSINVANNSNLIFTAGGGIDYLSVSNIYGLTVAPPTPTNNSGFFAIL